MTFCGVIEADLRDRARRRRQLRSGDRSTAVMAHDAEHDWRAQGEWAIREEMARRVETWLRSRNER